MKEIQWMIPRASVGTLGSITRDWSNTKHSEKVIAAAPTGQMAAAQYGLDMGAVITLTIRKNCPISENCGVWLENTENPWGIVVAVRRYPLHTEADVKRLVM